MKVDTATRRLVRQRAGNGRLTLLFHPRQNDWNEHFVLTGSQITGLTETGRGTVALFNMNDDDRCKLRSAIPSQ